MHKWRPRTHTLTTTLWDTAKKLNLQSENLWFRYCLCRTTYYLYDPATLGTLLPDHFTMRGINFLNCKNEGVRLYDLLKALPLVSLWSKLGLSCSQDWQRSSLLSYKNAWVTNTLCLWGPFPVLDLSSYDHYAYYRKLDKLKLIFLKRP